MQVWVAGAAGFIGSQVTAYLLEKGFSVVGLDNLNPYYDPKLKLHRLHTLQHENFHFYPVDITDEESLLALFRIHPPEIIFNLAAQAGVRNSLSTPQRYFETNTLGNLSLLEHGRKFGLRKYVLASTSSLYAGSPLPFTEAQPVNTPISPYAASKKAAEVTAYTYHHLYGIDVAILRYFTVYGPAGRPDMSIFRIIEWIWRGEPLQIFGDGKQSRDFTYVKDVAQATALAMNLEGFHVLNIGGGRAPTSLQEVIEFIGKWLGKTYMLTHLPPQTADILHTQADITLARNLLGWQPQTDFWSGLEDTLTWHKENRSLLDTLSLP
ncbi:MAG: NAD-dependent epimerase/dehydratase family protein [Bacteroidia bacterium]